MIHGNADLVTAAPPAKACRGTFLGAVRRELGSRCASACKAANKRPRAAISPKLFFKLKVMACTGLPEIRTGQGADHLSVFNSR